ncbi:DUF2971 domain-containing protein [Chryseobacterium taihuense]|uniref:DUF2971 domain-containing protein n=1 Tax=Chryseobacterium taihuense TaxID=1141221 RepID=A0ABY0QRL8_9FLAO|nr:DUF2971 domain-containing protein [Chryseobacterium taihuense]SDL64982.1 Protein of unknown function [Chryseobacterium taihuense]
MKVYKYRSNYNRDLITLFLNQLYAPTYDKLNDPFEGIYNEKEDKKILDLLKSFGSNPLEKAYEEIITTVKQKGIYSLCKTFDNEILWSLYSDSHKGFVIEYDLDILIQDFNFNKITPLIHVVDVNYKDTPQQSMIIRDSINKYLDLANIIGTKSLSWQHENEIRLIFEDSGINTFNFKAVTSIIFGLRTSENDINNTMNILKGRNLKYYKMETKGDSYKLKINTIEDLYKYAPKYIQNKAPFQEKLISDENISSEYQKYKNLIVELLNNISALPNIINIDSLEVYGDIEYPKVNVLTSTNLKILPIRFFQYQYNNSEFIQIN